MKRVISPSYTFTPGANQINLSGISGFSLSKLFAIINLTKNQLIYAIGQAGLGVTGVSGTILTLQAATGSMAANDSLMIIYDDGGKPAEDTSLQSILTSLQGILATNETKAPSGKTPVATSFTATGTSAAFAPLAGRGFNIEIRGTFVGTIQLERSLDSGTNWCPITAAGIQLYKWTTPASETASDDEVTAQFRLNVTAYTSGTIVTRISQ